MNLIIRPAQLHDIPYIMQIYNAEIEHGVATWNNQPKSLEEYQQWFQYLQEAEFPLFVAEETELKSFQAMLNIPVLEILMVMIKPLSMLSILIRNLHVWA